MAVKIRLARGGAKKRPFYRIVAADVRAPRDGRYIEKLGVYNPLLPKDSAERVTFDADRIKYWLSQGAKPTDRVHRFLHKAGLIKEALVYTEKKRPVKNPEKYGPLEDAKAEAPAEAAEETKADAAAEENAEAKTDGGDDAKKEDAA